LTQQDRLGLITANATTPYILNFIDSSKSRTSKTRGWTRLASGDHDVNSGGTAPSLTRAILDSCHP
jgi:hypothetical protein